MYNFSLNKKSNPIFFVEKFLQIYFGFFFRVEKHLNELRELNAV